MTVWSIYKNQIRLKLTRIEHPDDSRVMLTASEYTKPEADLNIELFKSKDLH